jgi:seryl-tRNA synthetase
MHDIRVIRDNPAAFDAALVKRGAAAQSATLIALDDARRVAIGAAQEAQTRRNELSKQIGQAKAAKDPARADVLMAQVSALKDALPQLEAAEAAAAKAFNRAIAEVPNIPADDVPDGTDEDGNVEQKRWGTPRQFDFAPKEHADLGPPLGMDFETGAALSGARFTFLRGAMARLHRALAQFMLDQQTEVNGYTECNPPVLVNDAAMFGTDKLPKFGNESFFGANDANRTKQFWEAMPPDFEAQMAGTRNGGYKAKIDELIYAADTKEQFWLIPTSEVPLTASIMGRILGDLADPIRMTAHTLCFRSEAGAAGRDTRGFIRQHQFEKVELVSVCRPEDSEAEHERMTRCAEGILEALDLPYRRMLLCAGDMGFGARKTFDLEVWLPGQDAWREISSCSNTGDFQARRMNARYRAEGEKTTQFVHTLNGSGLAVGRTLVAVIENYQQADGSVVVPAVLRPYMGGIEAIEPAR